MAASLSHHHHTIIVLTVAVVAVCIPDGWWLQSVVRASQMAPELLLQKDFDEKVDVYAFGAPRLPHLALCARMGPGNAS
jgi:hypothetical protein